jgi:hypothetical protein
VLAEAGPSEFPVDANTANAQRKVANSPTINQSFRIDVRGENPMVVEEHCLATCDGQAARTHGRCVTEEVHLRIARF